MCHSCWLALIGLILRRFYYFAICLDTPIRYTDSCYGYIAPFSLCFEHYVPFPISQFSTFAFNFNGPSN